MMWWKWLVLALMCGVIVVAFVTPPPQEGIGDASRIFYYHVPVAWVSVLAFATSMVYSVRFLRRSTIAEDDRAAEAARLGLVFCILATVSGSIFARVTWGSFWNWDPRETSILVLLLIYAAYFALRQAVADERARASLAAVYSIFAFLTVPFLVFVVPRVTWSLHPSDAIIDSGLEFTMSASVRWFLLASLAAFTILYFWVFSLGVRVRAITRNMTDRGLL